MSDAELNNPIVQEIADNALAVEKIKQDVELIKKIAEVIINAYKNGNKVLVMGNGGSAAQANHMVAELVGRYLFERPGMPAISLNTNPSVMTAIGNDYGYENLFVRQVNAHAVNGDIVIGISTSGNSPNVLNGFKAAKDKGCITIGLGSIRENNKFRQYKEQGMVDHLLEIRSEKTPHIQIGHIVVIHTICGLVEDALHKKA